MIECLECGKEFKEGDMVHVCNECEELVCVECTDSHNCLEEDVTEFEKQVCEDCGETEGKLLECNSCGGLFCGNCIEEHMREHIEFEEQEFSEYVSEKTAEEL